ncbi:MAG: hypothetical protein IH964_09255 [Candidatus Dadabacteria bacterium]|nr:hypothetical protein [Candidatus Dadabacteria bacterium]
MPKAKKKVVKVEVVDKGGRPTKLTSKLCDQLESIIETWNPLKDVNYDLPQLNNGFKISMLYLALCTKDNLAMAIGVSKQRLYDYQNKDNSSYDKSLQERFRDSIKGWETKRNALHMQMRLFFNKAEPTWIFLAKNFNQLKDDAPTVYETNITETTFNTLNISGEEARNVADTIYQEILRRRARNPAPKSPIHILQGGGGKILEI